MSGEFTASPRHHITSEPIINIPNSQSQSQSPTKPSPEAIPRNSTESLDSSTTHQTSSKKSPMRSALEHAKRKLSISKKDKATTQLSGSEEEFERARAKEVEKQKRKDEYERLGLGDKVKFGQGGMQMSG